MRWKWMAVVLGLWAMPAFAQDAGNSQDDGAKPAKPDIQPITTATLGWGNWQIGGNETKFLQYATPPRGIYLRELLYDPPASPQGYQGGLALKTPGQTDWLLAGRLDYLWGTMRFDGFLMGNRFYDPTPIPLDPSNRKIADGGYQQFLSRDVTLSFRYRMDDESRILETPRSPLHQRTRYADAVLSGKMGSGQGYLAITDWRYFDRTEVLPNTDVTRMQASYTWQPSSVMGVEGSYSRATIKQTSAENSHVDTLSLSGDMSIGSDTDVMVSLRRDGYDFPNALDAHVKRQNMAGIRAVQHWNGWTAQLGIREREIQRIRSDGSWVDVPRWWTFDGRLSGRLGRYIRFTASGWMENMTNGPVADTVDNRSLYWANRNFGQIKLETGRANWSGYLTGSYRNYDNGARSSALTNKNLTAGGTLEMGPKVSLFAEYTYDAWQEQTEVDTFPTGNNFAPDSRLVVLGLNWMLNKRTFLWAGYTDYATSNDNPLLLDEGNTHGHYLTLNVRHQLPSGCELGLIVAPWVHHDSVDPLMDYDSTVIMLTGSGKF